MAQGDHGTSYPYIPNSAPQVREDMRRYVGITDEEELYAAIPERLRYRQRLDLPPRLASEHELATHVRGLLARNSTCEEYLNFRGAGCWQHIVPAVCDEIAARGEFLTSYAGSPQSNLGANQAQFEFQSMLAELVGRDAVGVAMYDWGAAAASSLLMACRLTGRSEVIIPEIISPERRRQIQAVCGSTTTVRTVGYDQATGRLSLDHLAALVSERTAAVYAEVPSYLGIVDPAVPEAAALVHGRGGLAVVGVDPSSLAVLAPPSSYGADIVCGELQPLGIHMNYGGGLAGFIAASHEERYLAEFPSFLIGMLPTAEEGEYAFGWINLETTHYVRRDQSRDFTGTMQGLWGIVAGVYLALMGPAGMRELGESILYRTEYAIASLSALDGATVPFAQGAHFKEFVVRFDAGRTVADINAALYERGIFGGKDLSNEMPALGQSALYCVTEIHSKEHIDRLAAALKEILA
jgi:glycine dehydrogenase subunit 1